MATKNTPSIEELRAQLEAAEKAQEELNERRMQARQEAARAWYSDFLEGFESLETDLMSQENEADAAFKQSVRDHDMLTALTHWAHWRSFRYERNVLRSVQQNAVTQTGSNAHAKPDLRMYEASPFDEMVKILDQQAALLAEDRADKVREDLDNAVQEANDKVK